jgi:phenylpropionate dioxygenase-like ring-hydroxylating dioxygenase large terminal subunit
MPAARLPAWAYADTALFAAEREQLFRPSWQIAGHEAQLARAGEYLTIDLATERALLLRDEQGAVRAFRNTCRHRPHALLSARTGLLHGSIDCSVHGLRYGYDGRPLAGETPGDLSALEVATHEGLIVVRPLDAAPKDSEPLYAADQSLALRRLMPGGVTEVEVPADWKLIVEQWLESALAQRPVGLLAGLVQPAQLRLGASGSVQWQASLQPDAAGWTAGHYVRQARLGQRAFWQRRFLPPNQLLEARPDGALILQVIPEAPGRCRIRRFDLEQPHATRGERVMHFLAQRLVQRWLLQDTELAASIQSGLDVAGPQVAEAGAVPEALAGFRRGVFALLSGLSRPTAP